MRVYWYDGAPSTRGLSAEHIALAHTDYVELRLGFMNAQGQQKGVDSLIVTDLIELARSCGARPAALSSGADREGTMSAPIDYEAEYDNRARVPEHPEIFAAWARDAAAFREHHPPLTIAYGPGERQKLDLFRPQVEKAAAAVVFVHGGYWQALDRSSFSHLARGLLMHGIEVAIPSYTLAPQARVGEIVEEMRAAAIEMSRFGRPLVVAGHSAGGHLAACLLATHWKAVSRDLPEDLVRAAYAISGLFDLAPLLHTKVNGALGMDAAEAEAASPLLWEPPAGGSLDAVVGETESAEYHRQSRAIVEAWAAKGVATRYEAVPGKHHFDVVAPLADPHSDMVTRLLALVKAQERGGA